MTVFVDSFALIAWLNPNDAAHVRVAAYLDNFTGRMVTTEWVLMEFADALSVPPARSMAVDFLRALRADPFLDLVDYDPAIYQAGFNLYSARSDKSWSLTDCISFAVMTDRGITDALTADRHFEQAGFIAVFR